MKVEHTRAAAACKHRRPSLCGHGHSNSSNMACHGSNRLNGALPMHTVAPDYHTGGLTCRMLHRQCNQLHTDTLYFKYSTVAPPANQTPPRPLPQGAPEQCAPASPLPAGPPHHRSPHPPHPRGAAQWKPNHTSAIIQWRKQIDQ
jgi:hypothetical protein